MADNTPLPLATGSTRKAASDEVTYSGDSADVQLVRIVETAGAEGSRTVVSPNSLISTLNASTANLAGSAVFTGAWEDVSEYSHISVTLFSSHASATDGLQIQQSQDGVNPDFGDAFTIPAATGKAFSAAVQAKWFRIVYTNGATLTTAFRLGSLFSKQAKKSSAVRPQDGRSNDNDFEEVAAYLSGFNGTTWDRLKARAGALIVNADSRVISYRGCASTFRTPGRAGTTGQKIFALHNAAGSSVFVDVEKITVDTVATVVKAVTVLPPMIRVYRVTVLPTNGAAVTKVARNSAQSSSSSVTVFQDASADGTSSGTALTATLPAGSVIAGEFAARLITAAGYEIADCTEMLEEEDEAIMLRPSEGVVVMLDYTLATQNPTTDMWVVTVKWTEYTAG